MYRNLDDIIKASSAEAFIKTENKIYKYTNSDFAPENEEYIYIPMTRFESEVFEKIRLHLQNENCKGFFISKKLINTIEYLKILEEFSPKNVLVVDNVYSAGYKIAKKIANSLDFEIIILAGTDETSEIREKLSFNLNIENFNYNNYWEKTIDSILRADEKTKFVISETNIFKQKTAELIANLKKNSYVIFSKISFTNLKTYKTYENYNNEWIKLVSNSPKAVFIDDKNDLLMLPSINNLQVEKNLADGFLNFIGIKEIKEIKKAYSNITVNSTGSLYSIEKSIEKFKNENKEKRKIAIISKINGLEELEYQIHKEIFSKITEDFDSVILIGLNEAASTFRMFNKKTIIKKTGISDLQKIKNFIKWRKNNETAFLILSTEEKICSIV